MLMSLFRLPLISGQPYEMTWDATGASDTVAPLLTLTIDGTSVTTEPFASVSAIIE